MELSDVLKLECCDIDFKARDKDNALEKIAKLMVKTEVLQKIDYSLIYEALKKREELGSTGFGRGIAIPHCQLDNIDNFVVSIVSSRKGINFDSMDKKKVRILVTIVGPSSSRSGHLQLLAQISKILKEPGTMESLCKTSSRIDLYERFLSNSDAEIAATQKKGEEKLMLLIVRDDAIMEDITEIFLEYGIQESTIIETQQMENLLSKVPLFMGFFNFTGDKNLYSRIIMLKISKDYIDAVIKGFEDVFGNLDNFSGLSVMVLDLSYSRGI
ncbi:MAG: PTS sugar transporter subunit IIA [Candidatus Cloacimonetes bacterium]|nr:PTS sugar transporter subunit IIA [Candidatus Cloacimonadota bacterium]